LTRRQMRVETTAAYQLAGKISAGTSVASAAA
jgi:hypothetical protein